MDQQSFYSVILGYDYDLKKDDLNNDFSNIDNFINDKNKTLDNGFNISYCRISFKELCEQYAKNALGLVGHTANIYRLLGMFYINNVLFKERDFVSCSLKYIAYMVSCSLASVKRSIKKLIDLKIITKLDSGLHGRNIYKVINIFDFNGYGLILKGQNAPLDKKSSKKINLKKEIEINLNDNDLKSALNVPSWLRLYGINSQKLHDQCFINDADLQKQIKIAQYNFYLDD